MMQLILETEQSGDIKNMSMEVDVPVNGDFAEIKNELNQAIENTLTEKDFNPEQCAKSEPDLASVEITKEADLHAENVPQNNTIVISKQVLLEKNIAHEVITNGDRESVELEMENMFNDSKIEEMDVDIDTDVIRNLENTISSLEEQNVNNKPTISPELENNDKFINSTKADFQLDKGDIENENKLNLQTPESTRNITELLNAPIEIDNMESVLTADVKSTTTTTDNVQQDDQPKENDTLNNSIVMESNISKDTEISHNNEAENDVQKEIAYNVTNMKNSLLENGNTQYSPSDKVEINLMQSEIGAFDEVSNKKNTSLTVENVCAEKDTKQENTTERVTETSTELIEPTEDNTFNTLENNDCKNNDQLALEANADTAEGIINNDSVESNSPIYNGIAGEELTSAFKEDIQTDDVTTNVQKEEDLTSLNDSVVANDEAKTPIDNDMVLEKVTLTNTEEDQFENETMNIQEDLVDSIDSVVANDESITPIDDDIAGEKITLTNTEDSQTKDVTMSVQDNLASVDDPIVANDKSKTSIDDEIAEEKITLTNTEDSQTKDVTMSVQENLASVDDRLVANDESKTPINNEIVEEKITLTNTEDNQTKDVTMSVQENLASVDDRVVANDESKTSIYEIGEEKLTLTNTEDNQTKDVTMSVQENLTSVNDAVVASDESKTANDNDTAAEKVFVEDNQTDDVTMDLQENLPSVDSTIENVESKTPLNNEMGEEIATSTNSEENRSEDLTLNVQENVTLVDSVVSNDVSKDNQTDDVTINAQEESPSVKTKESISDAVIVPDPETLSVEHETKQDSINASDSINKVCDIDQEKVSIKEAANSDAKEISSENSADSMDIDIPDIVDVCKSNTDSNAIKNSQIEKASEFVDLDKDEADEQEQISKEKQSETISNENIEVIDDDLKIIEDEEPSKPQEKKEEVTKTLPVVCKLSNTLDILSDDEEEESADKEEPKKDDAPVEKQCIDIDDDDDVMFIEDDSNSIGSSNDKAEEKSADKTDAPTSTTVKTDLETGEKEITPIVEPSDITEPAKVTDKVADDPPAEEKSVEIEKKSEEKNEKPLLPEKFLKTAKKNLGEMTRDELEDFCIMKIVESLVDRSGLGEIKNKMKTMARSLEEYRKKAMLLTKQNRDLQVVLKSVQEEQKKRSNVIQPLKITRSVGMQVLMTDKPTPRRQGPIPNQNSPANRALRSTTQQNKNNNNTNNAAANRSPGAIPFPRLVPASNNVVNKSPINSPAKVSNPNGIRNPSPAPSPKLTEKRPQSRMQSASSSSVTVDLTDDEPPAKIRAKATSVPNVRLVPPQNLMQAKAPQFVQSNNTNNSTPRKVYIPISGPQAQHSIRPGQAVMLKTVSAAPGPRQRMPMTQPIRTTASTFKAPEKLRHPAPLPETMKQYTPATWKPLPPAPDIKLSKVENGIVISWKIDGVPENSYETVASYQLYAYQETSGPPTSSLWKKIGDVKALPLPMACTLTQFMAGFKYYFAVRAVDIRSRLGPFSVPGSIYLLSKV